MTLWLLGIGQRRPDLVAKLGSLIHLEQRRRLGKVVLKQVEKVGVAGRGDGRRAEDEGAVRDECLGELGRSGKQQDISNCWKSTISLGSPASSPILVSARAEGGTTDLCALGLACGRGRVGQVRVEVDDGERGRVCRLLGHLAIEQAIRRERESV